MKIHERERVVREADAALRQAVLDWSAKHDQLTVNETLQVLNRVSSDQVAAILKYEIREERHGDQDRPGGLE